MLVVGSTKDEAEKMKSKVYDTKFGKMASGAPDAKQPLSKESHAIVVYSQNEDSFNKISTILDQFDKH